MAKKKKKEVGGDAICSNRRARFLYHLDETFEAGVMLLGTEVKALREGLGSLTDSYVRMRGSEAFLVGCHIGPYAAASHDNHEPLRERKLLLHKRELEKFVVKVTQKGYTLVCTRLYFVRGKVKAEVALARGKKDHDKRAVVKERVIKKEMDRAMKRHRH